MNDRLKNMVTEYLIKTGKNSRMTLCAKAGISQATLIAVLKHNHVPQPPNVFRLALACGLEEGDALALAKGCVPAEARETA